MHRISTYISRKELRELLAKRLPFALPSGGALFITAETETHADGEGRREINDGVHVEIFFSPSNTPQQSAPTSNRMDLN